MFKNYLLIALRNLLKNKIYSFINIAGLSLGLACAMLIILYVKDEVSFDRFHKNVHNIYRVVTDNSDKDGNKRKDGNTGYFQGPKFAQNVTGIKSFVRVQSGSQDLKAGDAVQSQDLLYVDPGFFTVFSFPLLNGDAKTCLTERHSLVLSEDAARKQFGTTDALGKIMLLKADSAFVPYKVTAVTKRCPENSSIKFEMLLPFNIPAGEGIDKEDWFNFFLNTFVVLNPKADVQQVERQMQKFYSEDSKEGLQSIEKRYGDIVGSSRYLLQPFAGMHLSKELPAQNGLSGASNPVYAYILSGIALFILLIACINFVNLTIARSVRRAKEIGIRKVVGAERTQLTIQFLGESFLLCFMAFAFAILLAQLVLPVFNTLSNKALSISYLLDAKLIAGYIVLFFITGLLAGFYPALVLSGYNPVATLYNRFIPGGKNYLQKSLVVLQFALASFLIIATFTIYAQFNYLTTVKLGYDDSNLVIVRKQSMTRNEAALLKNELMKSPDIAGIAPKNVGVWETAAKVKGDSILSFSYETVDEMYLPLLKIPVLQGRNFSPAYPSDSSHAVLVNESFVKKAGWENPIGQQVNFWYQNDKKYTVVGIVKDHHFEALNQEIKPQLFTMKKKNDYGLAFIKIKQNRQTSSLRHIGQVFKKLFPASPYTYAFKDLENIKNYESEAKWKQIMLFSALLTIFISCIGLFGLSVLTAEKRTKEIGIRKVLGASIQNIVTILSRDFVKLVIIALLLSIPLAWMATDKWLESYPYKIVLSWQIFGFAGALVIFIALVTVSFQAVKAAMANPVKSLRTE